MVVGGFAVIGGVCGYPVSGKGFEVWLAFFLYGFEDGRAAQVAESCLDV